MKRAGEILSGGIDASEVSELQKLIPEVKTKFAQLRPEEQKAFLAKIETAEAEANARKALATDPSVVALKALKASTETLVNAEYSLDGLKTSVEDPKAKKFIELYQAVIAGDLEELYGKAYTQLSPTGKETIKLIFWNTLQSQFGIAGGINIMKGKIGSIGSSLSGLFGKAKEESTGSILTASLKAKGDVFGKLQPENKKDIQNALDIVESLIGKQADNLDALFKLTTTLTPEQKTQVFENPTVLNSVMNTGKYVADGFNINLKKQTAEVGQVSDLGTIQQTFLASVSKEAQGLGGKIEGMKSKVAQIEKTMKDWNLGDLDGMKKTLFSIPIIGVIFKMVLGDFFQSFDSAKSLAAIDSIMDGFGNKNHKEAVKVFRDSFVPKFTKDTETAKTPLGKVLAGNTEDFYKATPTFLTTLDDAKIDYSGSDFWNKILTGKDAGPKESIIYAKLKPTLTSINLDEKSLIKAISSISVNDFAPATKTSTVAKHKPTVPHAHEGIPKKVVTTNTTKPKKVTINKTPENDPRGNQLGVPDAISGTAVLATATTIVTPPEVAPKTVSIEEQIAKADSFPIQLSDGREISVNSETKTLDIGDESFTVTQLKKGDTDLLGEAFELSGLDFGRLSLKTHAAGKFLIKLNNASSDTKTTLENGEILHSSIKPETMRETLLALINQKNHSIIDKTNDLIVKISQV